MTAVSPPAENTLALGRQGRSYLALRIWRFLGIALLNLFAFLLAAVYLFPMSYMAATSLKIPDQFGILSAPLWPAKPESFTYEGKSYDVYLMPTEQGERHVILIQPGRKTTTYLDIENPAGGLIEWEGNWRGLKRAFTFHLHWENLTGAWQKNRMPDLIKNTMYVAAISWVGVMLSSIAVAYGFSRFRIPGINWLFLLLVGSMMIPEKITLIPTYIMWFRNGYLGSYVPLITPFFFGNAVYIFLLRQNFKSIPKDMDEAAMLDGASPVRILISIILPQSYPVVITVSLLHFFHIWNEARLASLYLGIKPQLYTIAFGIQNQQNYFPQPNQLQASTLLVMMIPVLILFLTQRVFMNKVLVTGSEAK